MVRSCDIVSEPCQVKAVLGFLTKLDLLGNSCPLGQQFVLIVFVYL